jgi:TetR/AcrR family transcriptional regulator, transcriptional repressor for nem operon
MDIMVSGMTDLTLGGGAKSEPGADKRSRLVSAARRTMHENGVERTTLAIVAAAADVPVGNVYYYFKTKDELLTAVIDANHNDFALLETILSRHRTPKGRLKAMIRAWTSARDRLTRYGCPLGSLCSELDKRDDAIAVHASALLSRLIMIAQDQFEQLGRRDARDLAVAFVASYEGVVLLANTLRDPELISTEARRLERWIDSLA